MVSRASVPVARLFSVKFQRCSRVVTSYIGMRQQSKIATGKPTIRMNDTGNKRFRSVLVAHSFLASDPPRTMRSEACFNHSLPGEERLTSEALSQSKPLSRRHLNRSPAAARQSRASRLISTRAALPQHETSPACLPISGAAGQAVVE